MLDIEFGPSLPSMSTESSLCPRDGAALRQEQYEGVTIDVCGVCRGTWLDRGELEKIQEEKEVGDESREQRPGVFGLRPELAEREDHIPIACLRCGGAMETREHGFASQVLVDSCVDGCGLWLDAGELQALERFFDDNRDNTTLPLHWRLWATIVSALR